MGKQSLEQEISLQSIRQALREVLREEMGMVCHGLFEGKFYHNLAMEMETGIGEMYQKIGEFRKSLDVAQQTADRSQQLISDASDQLGEIVNTTESATNQIMDAVEACQARNNRAAQLLAALPASGERNELQKILGASNIDYMNIITSCSFQDLTGQRVKKVVDLIEILEKQMVALLISSGTKLKEKRAGLDDHEIEGKTRQVMAKLTSKDEGFSQQQVDELLASLRQK